MDGLDVLIENLFLMKAVVPHATLVKSSWYLRGWVFRLECDWLMRIQPPP